MVKEDAGKIAGSLVGDVEIPLLDPKFEGGALRFQIKPNQNAITFELKLDGNKLEGRFRGAEANGSFKATRQA